MVRTQPPWDRHAHSRRRTRSGLRARLHRPPPTWLTPLTVTDVVGMTHVLDGGAYALDLGTPRYLVSCRRRDVVARRERLPGELGESPDGARAR